MPKTMKNTACKSWVKQKVKIDYNSGSNTTKKIVGIIGHTPYAKKFKYVPLVPEIGYQKRLFLYGMDKIDRKNDTAILVEGLFDVIAG